MPLVHLRNADAETALHLAAETGHLQTLDFLLAQGSDVTVADTDTTQTAFHAAARAGRVWAFACLRLAATARLGPEGARALLRQPDAEGHTCLDWAAANGHLPNLKLLLRLGALDPWRPDPAGRCDLHLAARGGHADVCRYLVQRRGLDPQRLWDAQGQTPLAHARGDRHAVLAALRVRPAPATTGVEAADEADIPTRPQHPRATVVWAYTLAPTAAWAAPFFLAWYWALPLLAFTSLLFSCARGRQGGQQHRHGRSQQQVQQAQGDGGQSAKGPLPLTQWAAAQEAYPGFWLGTVVAFAAADPLLRSWPRPVAWLQAGRGEMAAPPTTSGLPFGGGRAAVIAMYVLFGATVLLWADIVFWRADPCIVPFDGRALEETLAWVAATGAPPPESHTCRTCLFRRPLRSKVRVCVWEGSCNFLD